jgi:hypothetical protein
MEQQQQRRRLVLLLLLLTLAAVAASGCQVGRPVTSAHASVLLTVRGMASTALS